MKTFNASKAKWVGQKIFGVKDKEFNDDSKALGTLYEHWVMTGEDKYEILDAYNSIEDMEGVMEKYDTLKHNSQGLEFIKGERNVRAEGEIGGVRFIGYIDNLTQIIDDIKTSQYLTKPDAESKNFRSGMTTYEEYELQLWIYMKLTNITKSRIVEVSKHRYKDETRHEWQILEFELTEEFDKKMSEKWIPIIHEMHSLYKEFAEIARMSKKEEIEE